MIIYLEMLIKRKGMKIVTDLSRLFFYWTNKYVLDGAIIGSKAFVRDVSFQFYEKEKVLKKKFSHGQGIDKTVFHCFKTLRKGVYWYEDYNTVPKILSHKFQVINHLKLWNIILN